MSKDRPSPVFGLKGSTVSLPCSSVAGSCPSSADDSATQSAFRNATWTRENGRVVTDGRFKVGPCGRLEISEVQAEDGGKYQCRTILGGKPADSTAELLVVLPVIYGLNIQMDLQHVPCPSNPSNATAVIDAARKRFKRYCLEDETSTSSKKYCEVKDVEVSCHSGAIEPRSVTGTSDATTAKGLKINATLLPKVQKWELEKCGDDLACRKRLGVEKLAEVGDRLLKILKKPARRHSAPKGSKRVATAVPEVRHGVTILCPPGYEIKEDRCAACARGHAGRGGTEPCIPCPIGSYQDQAGSSSCNICHGRWLSNQEGETSDEACLSVTDFTRYKVIAGVVVGLALWLVILGIIILFCSWWKKSSKGAEKLCYRCASPFETLPGGAPESGNSLDPKYEKTYCCEYRETAGRRLDHNGESDAGKMPNLESGYAGRNQRMPNEYLPDPFICKPMFFPSPSGFPRETSMNSQSTLNGYRETKEGYFAFQREPQLHQDHNGHAKRRRSRSNNRRHPPQPNNHGSCEIPLLYPCPPQQPSHMATNDRRRYFVPKPRQRRRRSAGASPHHTRNEGAGKSASSSAVPDDVQRRELAAGSWSQRWHLARGSSSSCVDPLFSNHQSLQVQQMDGACRADARSIRSSSTTPFAINESVDESNSVNRSC